MKTSNIDLRVAALVSAVKAKGSDAMDARDAAHEACHALMWGVKKKWTRDNIHAKKPRGSPSFGVRDEITARAVEALVCAELGIEYEQDKYVLLCIMETLRSEHIALPGFDWLKDAIVSRMKSPAAIEMASRVLAMANQALTNSPGSGRGRA